MVRNSIEAGIHVIFWCVCLWMLNQNFAMETVEIREVNGQQQEVFTRNYDMFFFFLVVLITKAGVFYGNAFWWLPSFLKTRNTARFLLSLLKGTGAAVLFEFLLNWGHSEIYDSSSFQYFSGMWPFNSILYILFLGISMGYGLGKNWLENEKIKQQIMQEKLSSELNFLKSQMNPHFLFNTLNSLFAQAERQDNKELAEGIFELSNLMRYMLYDCKEDRVFLEKEIQFIKSMIGIQQMRLSDDDAIVTFRCHGQYKNEKIAPLILSPFVENAFKYGIHQKRKSLISVHLTIAEGNLDFRVENPDYSQDQANGFGIGIENTKRRLELIYPERHSLKLNRENGTYKVHLEIKLR